MISHKYVKSIVCLFIICEFLLGQRLQRNQQVAGNDSYPIPGSHRITKQWQKEKDILLSHGITKHTRSLTKKEAYNFTVGSQRSWYATDISTVDYYEYLVPSTCRAVGTNCYIFVEDVQWGTRVTQQVVDSVLIAFEQRTPSHSQKGIYQLDTTFFGVPPDVDGDPRIIILILDIKDGYSGSGNYVAGYYYSLNQYTEQDVQKALGNKRHSNYAEIYYIDCNPANLMTSKGITEVAGTTAHELQHMIHWNYDDDEDTFVNEGCSEIAEKLCGYGLRNPSLYYSNTNVNFLSWQETEDVLADYSRAALFTWYLVEQFGVAYIKRLVQSTQVGENGYNEALQKVGVQYTFKDVLKNFAIATKLNNKSFNPQYGFELPILSYPSNHRTHIVPSVPAIVDTLKPYGTCYIAYTSGTSLSIHMKTKASLSIRMIALGQTQAVTDIPIGQNYTVNGFGTSYSTVIFAITNLNTYNVTYSYSSTGTANITRMELKYDESEPIGYLPLSVNDTVCVWFDGVSGMKLDSIRIALRRAGSMQGGIWSYSGAIRPTPLGKKLAVPIIATTTQTPGIPYPVPWSNWATVDLRSYNIDASAPFAVAFVVSGESTTAPRVMVTKSPQPPRYTSLTYTNGNWYYLTSNDGGDSVYTYLIRAYISNDTNGMDSPTEPTELLPNIVQLYQNYPNPFNPGTTFHYSLPEAGYVKLVLYDVLGREVYVIYEGESLPDNRIYWQPPATISSGTYFYKIYTKHGMQTKKLVLIR
ncbi:MAG: T9SS type A sorting domain-containing protein [Bacteroidetes bacterium]|nr:T9SS type A sorting domain-containing protein [Bacteroidota bacterium]